METRILLLTLLTGVSYAFKFIQKHITRLFNKGNHQFHLPRAERGRQDVPNPLPRLVTRGEHVWIHRRGRRRNQSIMKRRELLYHDRFQPLWVCYDKRWFSAERNRKNLAVLLYIVEHHQVNAAIFANIENIADKGKRFRTRDVKSLQHGETACSIPVDEYKQRNCRGEDDGRIPKVKLCDCHFAGGARDTTAHPESNQLCSQISVPSNKSLSIQFCHEWELASLKSS